MLAQVVKFSLITCCLLLGARPAVASKISHDQVPSPSGVCDDRGGGGQPDPLSAFNSHVELADGELYMLKGKVTIAPALSGASRKNQPYFNVDLEVHPWLSTKARKASPMYLIEGPLSFWRPYAGSYGELAAIAHVQLYVTETGDAVQVISLKAIPELCSIPKVAGTFY